MTLPDGVHTTNHIIFILTFWLGCYGVWFVFSLCLRYFTKKPIVPHMPKTAVFHAERCSGRLLRDAMRPIKSLRGSLLVYIADQNLYVVPRFPFNLVSVHDFYSFEFAVPLAAITTIEPIEHLEGGAVRINFNSTYRAPIELHMKDPQTFIDILRSAIPQTKTGSTSNFQHVPHPHDSVAPRLFLGFFGSITTAFALNGLCDDYRYRAHGMQAVGVFEDYNKMQDGRDNRGVLTYCVDGQRYHLRSMDRAENYRIGDTQTLLYLPGRPDLARQTEYLGFDSIWLCGGLLCLAVSLFGERLIRRLRGVLNPLFAKKIY